MQDDAAPRLQYSTWKVHGTVPVYRLIILLTFYQPTFLVFEPSILTWRWLFQSVSFRGGNPLRKQSGPVVTSTEWFGTSHCSGKKQIVRGSGVLKWLTVGFRCFIAVSCRIWLVKACQFSREHLSSRLLTRRSDLLMVLQFQWQNTQFTSIYTDDE